MPPVEPKPPLPADRVIALDCAGLLGPMGSFPVSDVLHARLADLNAGFLASRSPTLIILPLFAAQHDATSVIATLQTLGYAGRIAILAPDLPRPKLVEDELRRLGPGTRLSLITP